MDSSLGEGCWLGYAELALCGFVHWAGREGLYWCSRLNVDVVCWSGQSQEKRCIDAADLMSMWIEGLQSQRVVLDCQKFTVPERALYWCSRLNVNVDWRASKPRLQNICSAVVCWTGQSQGKRSCCRVVIFVAWKPNMSVSIRGDLWAGG